MSTDSVSALVRAGALISLFQTVGIALFLAIFGNHVTASGAIIRRLGLIASAGGIILVIAHLALEAARMADGFEGVMDPDLQGLAMRSATGATHGLQLLGLILMASGLAQSQRSGLNWALAGSALAIFAFALTGHTSVHSDRWLLAPILLLHLSIVAFWFGALAPLFIVTGRESLQDAAWILEKFSKIAGWLVPCILVAGLAMALLLIPHVSVLCQPYGELLVAKVVGFGLLLGLAARNKWRLVPTFRSNPARSIAALRRSIAAEYALIVVVLSLTAVLTTYYSPGH